MKPNGWPSIVGIFLFGVCGGSTVSKVVPLIGDFELHFGLSPANFGWLVALVALPAAIFAIPSGSVVQKFGPKNVLLFAAVLGVLSNALYLVAPSIAVIQLARVCEGLAIVHIYTAGPAMLLATTEGKKRTQAMTLWATYAPVGTAIGLAVGGFFAETAGYRNTFIAHGSIYAATGLLGLLQPRVPTFHNEGKPNLESRFADLGSAFRQPLLVALAGGLFLLIGMGLGINVTLPDYLARVHGVSVQYASNLVASATLMMIVGSASAGFLLPRGMRQFRLFVIFALSSFVMGTASFFPQVPLENRWLVLAGWFFASGASLATALAILPNLVPRDRSGPAAALMNFAGALAALGSPPLWLAISSGGQWRYFVILLGCGFASACILIWLATRPGKISTHDQVRGKVLIAPLAKPLATDFNNKEKT